MKNFMLLVLTCFYLFSFDITAQSVFPDETVDQKWEYTTWNFWGGSCYKRIIKTGERKTICFTKNFIEILDCNEQEEECRIIGYYRIQNDSIIVRTNHLYLNKTMDSVVCDEPEGLIYDFGTLKKVEINCQINSLNPPIFTEFWKTDQQTINYLGTERTTLFMTFRPHSSEPNFLSKMNWIEGIGSTVHPFYSLSCIGDHCEWEQQLTKVTRDGIVIYQDTAIFSFPCRTWVKTKSPQKIEETFIIAPNPASASFSIKSKSKETKSVQLSIRDLMGRIVVPQFDYQLNELLNIDVLISGTYMISIINNQKHSVLKIVKK